MQYDVYTAHTMSVAVGLLLLLRIFSGPLEGQGSIFVAAGLGYTCGIN